MNIVRFASVVALFFVCSFFTKTAMAEGNRFNLQQLLNSKNESTKKEEEKSKKEKDELKTGHSKWAIHLGTGIAFASGSKRTGDVDPSPLVRLTFSNSRTIYNSEYMALGGGLELSISTTTSGMNAHYDPLLFDAVKEDYSDISVSWLLSFWGLHLGIGVGTARETLRYNPIGGAEIYTESNTSATWHFKWGVADFTPFTTKKQKDKDDESDNSTHNDFPKIGSFFEYRHTKLVDGGSNIKKMGLYTFGISIIF
ncbi:MAG: hypothetical protein ABIH42_03890 [Planctomycetota bacterium]